LDYLKIKKSFWDYIYILLGSFLIIPLQVISVSLSTRILGASGYGKLSIFLMVSELVFLFSASWTSASVIRYGTWEFNKENKINKVFWARNSILIPSLLFFFIGIIFFRKSISSYIGIEQKAIIWLLLLYIAVIVLVSYIQYIQQSIGQLRLYSFSLFLVKLIVVTGLSVIKVTPVLDKDASSIIIVYILGNLITAVIFTLFIKIKVLLPVEFDKDTAKKIFLFSYPLVFGSVSSYAIGWVDIIFVKKDLMISDVGVYALAYRIMTFVNTISMSLIVLLGPIIVTFLANKRVDLINKYIKRLIPQVGFLSSIFISIIIVVINYFVALIFGIEFADSVLPSSILMLGMAFNFFSSMYSPVIVAYELIKQSVAVNIIMAIINIIGDYLLIPLIGINGAAYTTSFIYSLGAVSYLIIVNRKLKINKWRHLLTIIPAFLTFLLILLTDNHMLIFSILIVIYVLGYFLVRILRIFKKEDLAMFDKVEMPVIVRKILTRTYNFFDYRRE